MLGFILDEAAERGSRPFPMQMGASVSISSLFRLSVMDCLQSAQAGCAPAALCIPGSSAASQDSEMLCSLSGNTQEKKPSSWHLCSRCFGVFFPVAVGSDTCAVVYPQARFGEGFSRPQIHSHFLLDGGGGALHQDFPGQASASPSRLAKPSPAQFSSHWNIG